MAPEQNRDIHLNSMHFNERNGSGVLHAFKAMISSLSFQHPMVSPIIPREAQGLPRPCVRLITFIDLIGPPGHFSKTVIENAACQVSRSWGDWSGQGGSRGGGQSAHQPLQQGTLHAGAKHADPGAQDTCFLPAADRPQRKAPTWEEGQRQRDRTALLLALNL